MNRYRKKAGYDLKRKQHTIIIETQTEQVEFSKAVSKKIKNNEKSPPQSKNNSYEQIREIPEITLTKEQMNGDPIDIVMKLQQKYRDYGAVKIRTPDEWNPPFNFKYTEKPITTRIQKIHRLKQGKAFDQKYEEYSIKTFTDYALAFERQYRPKFQRNGATLESQMENEYWQIVNGVQTDDPKVLDKYKVTIEYAADLPSHQYGSGFPIFQTSKAMDQNFNYATNCFNLNNIYKSPQSILKITENNKEKISGVTIPWVYMGMQFSTFCWHVEDLWLNSINYSHKGATKTWYVIPQSDKERFDAFVLKKTGKREFLNSITFMIDPLELIDNGIKVYKAYQRPREYILTLFNAYHSGFSQGYNVGEAVNVGTIESLSIIRKAQLFNTVSQKTHRPPVLCYEWLVAANLGNSSINQQEIISQYSKITTQEYNRLKIIAERGDIRSIQYVDPHLKYDRLSCHTCRYYQYLSVLKCIECDKKFCLEHADKCCGKGFIFVTRESDKYRKKTIDLIKEQLK